MKSLYISAAHKSSGKTTVSIGLSSALTQRGLQLQCFKKGPDYIDPKWLEKATGNPCYNLDFYTMHDEEILAMVARQTYQRDIGIVEGNKGLYDGVDLHGSDSNAALAKLLDIPVLLVIDCSGITRGVAPLLQGYKQFDSEIKFAGVIINKVGGPRHEEKLRAVIEAYTDLPVVGAIGRNPDLEIRERHLGLIPSNEEGEAEKIIRRLKAVVETNVDVDRIITSMMSPKVVSSSEKALPQQPSVDAVKIGVLSDAAFGFYYPDDLEALQAKGAELVFIDATQAPTLPAVDALFIGGGFPEALADQLAANTKLRNDIKTAIEKGLPAYAECGGLMYLTRSIEWKGKKHDMVGVIRADTVMYERPIGRGYARLKPLDSAPWLKNTATIPDDIPAHEFHYSRLENIDSPLTYAYKVLRGTGIDGQHDGIIYKNLLANYAHLRDTDHFHWTEYFMNFIRNRTGANS